MAIKVSEAEYAASQDNNTGICLACGSRQGGCEPDARRRKCESCDKFTVHGMEEAFISGKIEVETTEKITELNWPSRPANKDIPVLKTNPSPISPFDIALEAYTSGIMSSREDWLAFLAVAAGMGWAASAYCMLHKSCWDPAVWDGFVSKLPTPAASQSRRLGKILKSLQGFASIPSRLGKPLAQGEGAERPWCDKVVASSQGFEEVQCKWYEVVVHITRFTNAKHNLWVQTHWIATIVKAHPDVEWYVRSKQGEMLIAKAGSECVGILRPFSE